MKQPKVARTLGENTSIVILRADSLIVSVGKKTLHRVQMKIKHSVCD